MHLRHLHPLPPGLEAIFRALPAGPGRRDERRGPLRLRPAGDAASGAATRLPSIRSITKTDGLTFQDPRNRGRRAHSSLGRSRLKRRRLPNPHQLTAMPSAAALVHVRAPPRRPLTKKALTADHPTWCPGCGDFAVLAAFYRVLEKLQYPHENIVTMAGIGCSSRFPYFVNTHGGHYHPRPLAAVFRGGEPRRATTCTSSSSAATATASRSAATTLSIPRRKNVQADLRHHGQLRLRADQEADLAHVADRLQVQDRPDRRDRPADQPDAHARQQRRHLRRPQPRDAGQPHDRDDGARRPPRRLLGRRDPVGVRGILRRARSTPAIRARAAQFQLDRGAGRTTARPRTRSATTRPTRSPPSGWPRSRGPAVFGVFYEIQRPTKNRLEADLIARRGRRPRAPRTWRCSRLRSPSCADRLASARRRDPGRDRTVRSEPASRRRRRAGIFQSARGRRFCPPRRPFPAP